MNRSEILEKDMERYMYGAISSDICHKNNAAVPKMEGVQRKYRLSKATSRRLFNFRLVHTFIGLVPYIAICAGLAAFSLNTLSYPINLFVACGFCTPLGLAIRKWKRGSVYHFKISKSKNP